MTDQEFETVALALKAAYPNSNVLPDKYAMKVWYRMLGDLESAVVENAVWEHIGTSPFPPSIAEIREKCTARLSPMVTDWGRHGKKCRGLSGSMAATGRKKRWPQ